MYSKLDSTTRTTVWHTRNTNLQLLSTGSWLLNMQSRKVHWRFLERSSQNWQQTQCRVASLPHFTRCTAFPPRPSCHIRPVSGGRSRCRSSPRRRRPRPAAPGPPPGGLPQPPGASARCLGPEGAAGDGDGTRQVTWVASEDFGGFRVWKIGSLVMFGPPFLTETSITAYRNQDQLVGKSHLCGATHCKPDQRFTITHYNFYNISKKSLESICIHLL